MMLKYVVLYREQPNGPIEAIFRPKIPTWFDNLDVENFRSKILLAIITRKLKFGNRSSSKRRRTVSIEMTINHINLGQISTSIMSFDHFPISILGHFLISKFFRLNSELLLR